jgi:hypothetical protein
VSILLGDGNGGFSAPFSFAVGGHQPISVAVGDFDGVSVRLNTTSSAYPRPQGASPARFTLVPAYGECTAPNRTHGAPLASPSCSPPTRESSHITVGSPDANGKPLNSSGFATYKAEVGAPGGVDDSDVTFTFSLSDVRTEGGTFPDYTGELQATTLARITDRLNGPAETNSATVTDIAFPVTVPCTATGGAANIGATCAITTSFDAVVPGTVIEGKRAVWELGQVEVYDGGPDGDVDTPAGNSPFAKQGIFVP